MSFINQRHITEENLNQAIATIVNAYSKLPLQKIWGTGKSASADGTKWDLCPQNLMPNIIFDMEVRVGLAIIL